MYNDEDLDNAVERGIFNREAVEQFRAYISAQNRSTAADEENIRLITSFNDIFVVIACSLLLLSVGWVSHRINSGLSSFMVALYSWGLAEFFVRKRHMALPAIVLLISFVGGLFSTAVSLFSEPGEAAFMSAALLTGLGAWLHWLRFRVPISVAAGALTALIFSVALLLSIWPELNGYLLYFVLLGGLILFGIAMRWDSADPERRTSKADVAFWLHLAAAPLIIHPAFISLGFFEGEDSTTSLLAIFAIYIVLTLISLVIDRRAFMVSALIYVLVALTKLLESYGLAGDSFAYVGLFIGFSLLMLSGFWHTVRNQLVAYLPHAIKNKVPTTS